MSKPGEARVSDPPVDGSCASRFTAVRDAFRINFTEDGEWGAAACVMLNGQTILDIWGGYTDWAQTAPWQRDQLVNAYSTGKGLAAMLALNAIDRGEIDLETPVARVWPEFAVAGKSDITLRVLLAHRAGLPAVRPLLQPEDKYHWDLMCRTLANEKPYWTPDSGHGYHVNTFGYLVGETLRRVTGLGIGELLQTRIAGPVEADYYWGVPAAEHHRIAPLLENDEREPSLDNRQQWQAAFPPTGDTEHDEMIWRTYFNPPGLSGHGAVDTLDWRNAVIPSTNGHGNARALARLYDCFVRSGQFRPAFVSDSLRDEATRIHSDGDDIVLGFPSRFGLGFQLPLPNKPVGPNPMSFGHAGYGGSLGWADPDLKLAMGYVTNKPAPRFQLSRALRVLNTVYDCL